MQVLQITSVPVQYKLNIEHARLEYQQDFIPRAEVKTTPPELNLETQNIQVRLDTYQARRSVGFNKVQDLIADGADRGRQAVTESMRNSVETGKQMSNIAEGVTISQIIEQKTIGNQPGVYTAFLPSGGTDISWVPNNINIDYQGGSLNYDWKDMQQELNYVPGSVHMEILEYPRVDIEYTGGPIYIPRSADPNYEG